MADGVSILAALLNPPALDVSGRLRRVPRLYSRLKWGQGYPTSKYIGRPNRYGNPYHLPPGFRYLDMVQQSEARQRVVEQYALWLPESGVDPRELRGLDLNCFCHDWDGSGRCPFYCHGDVLLICANAPDGWWDEFAR